MSTTALKALAIPVSYLPRSGPIVRRLAPRRDRVVRQRFRCGAIFDLDLSDRIQAESFIRRSYQPALCEWIAARLGPGDLFMDVGANVGLVSFSVATSGARLVAFEPNPENCASWRANVALNSQVAGELVEAAVGDSSEPLRMRAAIDGESGWCQVQEGGPIEVRQVTLDGYCADHRIGRIDVLKVDVEGYEAAVIAGAARLLSEGRVGAVVCEINVPLGGTDDLIATLEGYGYRRERLTSLDSAFVR